MKLYVGCSLTHASEDFKLGVENFKAALRREGHEVFDFVGLVNGSEREVYEWDIKHCVGECEALVVVCDEPSIGLGYEMCEGVRLGKPVIAVAHKDSKVTRLVLGAAEVEDNLQFVRYEDITTDILPIVNKLAEKAQ